MYNVPYYAEIYVYFLNKYKGLNHHITGMHFLTEVYAVNSNM